jgi:hypothetical protein
MANSIVAGNSTNGGTAISTDTSGTLNIVTGSGSGANAITIDASQAVTVPGTLAVTGAQTVGGNLTVTGSITGGSISVANSLRAWILFNGSGTPAIRASFNVTSLTDTSTGTYFVNFTTAMTDANYSVCGTAASPGASYGILSPYNGATAQTTTAVPISTLNLASSVYDHTYISVAIFR